MNKLNSETLEEKIKNINFNKNFNPNPYIDPVEKSNYLITIYNYTNSKFTLLLNLIKEIFKNKLDYHNNRLNSINIENSFFLL